MSRHELAEVVLERGRFEEALELAERAWSRRRQRDDIMPRERAQTAFLLARTLSSARTSTESRARAERMAEQAVRDYAEAGDSHEDARREVERWLERHRAND